MNINPFATIQISIIRCNNQYKFIIKSYTQRWRMKQKSDYWFDSDSSNFVLQNDNVGVYSPRRDVANEWGDLLRQEQKQIMDESIETFPEVKRKYEARFNTKIQTSSSSSPFDDDDISIASSTGSAILKQRSALMKQQRQQIKKIEQQNRFLKQKIDDISFRLRETQVQLNKLKYSGNNNIANFQSLKESCLKEISDLMGQHKGQSPETCLAFGRLKDMTSFDGKIKVDLLNYFMSELLQNIINDSTFYFIDSMLGAKGLWMGEKAEQIKMRKVDEEFIELMQIGDEDKCERFKKDLYDALVIPATKYKQIWKTFYKSYINLLNQGFVVENFLRHATQRIISYLPRENFAKLQLHFEKIKLRKDIRALRQSWFKQIQYDEQNTSSPIDKLQANKKTKTHNS